VSNPVDDDEDLVPFSDDDGERYEAVGLDLRRRAQVAAGDEAAAVVAELVRGLPPLEDVEAWAARDAQLAAKQRAAEERQARLFMERRALLFTSAAIQWPERLVDDAIAADVNRPLMQRVATFGEPKRGQRNVLVLEGGVGAGKSTAGTWWAMRHGRGAPLYVRSATFEGEGRYDRDFRARVREASAIVLDDLGAEFKDGKGNLTAALDELVDIVYSRRLPTVITTNLTRDAFTQRYEHQDPVKADGAGRRLLSRLRGCAAWSSVSSGDLRGKPR
jgi:hypothetical protein